MRLRANAYAGEWLTPHWVSPWVARSGFECGAARGSAPLELLPSAAITASERRANAPLKGALGNRFGLPTRARSSARAAGELVLNHAALRLDVECPELQRGTLSAPVFRWNILLHLCFARRFTFLDGNLRLAPLPLNTAVLGICRCSASAVVIRRTAMAAQPGIENSAPP